MVASSDERRDALLALLERAEPIADSIERLSRFPWDSEEDLALLRAEHVVGILQAFLANQITEQHVETWAEVLQGRDDLAIDTKDEENLKQALFELSTPEINGPMRELTVRWLARLTVQD